MWSLFLFFLKEKKEKKTPQPHFSSVPFTDALGDPFVCVLLLPCIGWTVNCCHLLCWLGGLIFCD